MSHKRARKLRRIALGFESLCDDLTRLESVYHWSELRDLHFQIWRGLAPKLFTLRQIADREWGDNETMDTQEAVSE